MAHKRNGIEALANKHVPRPNQLSFPRLLAPKLPYGDSPLPPFASFDLLRRARGTHSLPTAALDEAISGDQFHDGKLLKTYLINQKLFKMQEVQHEVEIHHQRRTIGGRTLDYHLKIVQGPQRARACGNGPRSHQDRRPVDPPPVVRLQIYHNGCDVTGFYEASFLLWAGLEHARPYARGTLATTTHCPVLAGNSVAGAAYLARPIPAAYFIFPDLSVRHEGHFRLKFHLFEQPRYKEDRNVHMPSVPLGDGFENVPPPNPEESMTEVTYVYSEPFQVFSAKKFPGLEQSTQLSRVIADQGCRVRIRRDIRQRRSGHKDDKKDDEPPLRAASPDRKGHDSWRPPPIDTRRASVDSQLSQSYVAPSRQQSFNQQSISSPVVAGPSHHYQRSTQYGPAATTSYTAEPEDMISSRRSSQSLAPLQVAPSPVYQRPLAPPAQRASLPPPVSPTQRFPAQILPPISHMLPSLPQSQPARPAGLYPTNPVTAKRGFSQSREESSTILKDGARPTLTPKSQLPNTLYGPYGYGEPAHLANKTPMVSGNQMIEADEDDAIDADEEDEDGHDTDDILNNISSYKRADGKYQQVHRVRI